MTPPDDILGLLDWKRRVVELYADARRSDDPEAGWWRWRRGRDELFRTHPQSPSPGHAPLAYFPYDEASRVTAKLRRLDAAPVAIDASGGGTVPFRPVAGVAFELHGQAVSLELYWLEGYGGGAFLPFRDATSGRDTYGGGRYLLDTVKGADLGGEREAIVLDFNFAYNPSCAYDARWVCPLAPVANTLELEIRAGECHRAAAQLPE